MILQVEDQKMATDNVIDSSGQTIMNVGQQTPAKANNNYGKQYTFKGRRTKEEKMLLYCPHYNRNRHEERDCFKLHRIPNWYKRMKEAKGKMKANFVDTSSQSEKQESRFEKIDQPFDIEKMFQTEFAKYMGQWMSKNSGMASPQKFDVNMMHNDSGSSEEFTGHYAFSILGGLAKDKWIVDSGASAHICCNPALMTQITTLAQSQEVYLPDGTIKHIDSHGYTLKSMKILLFKEYCWHQILRIT